MSMYVARVVRAFWQHGRQVVVQCPFCWQEHAHSWGNREQRPSREVLAGCSTVGDLSTYGIDEASAVAADAERAAAHQASKREQRQARRR